jgi:hypothetical protein
VIRQMSVLLALLLVNAVPAAAQAEPASPSDPAAVSHSSGETVQPADAAEDTGEPGEEAVPGPRDTDEERAAAVRRVYKMRYLNLDEALRLALTQCASAYERHCHGRIFQKQRFIELIADPATHAKIDALLQAKDTAPRAHLMNAIILEASDVPEAEALALPEAAAKALQEIRTWLPYKGFRLIANAHVVTAGGPVTMTLGAAVPAKGQPSFEINMSTELLGPPDDSVEVRAFTFSMSLPEMGQRQLIMTSLRLRLGETVVVGSSPSSGGNALLVLLTALPR